MNTPAETTSASRAAWRVSALPLLGVVLGLLLGGPAAAFEYQLGGLDAVVSVPGLPQVSMRRLAVPGKGREAEWHGVDQALAVDIQAMAAPAEAAVGTRACAGVFLRELVRRPGMPDRDSIYRAPLDVGNFLVLYILDGSPARQVHAHLLAAPDAGHCVDAHFSRPLRDGEDVDDWRNSFRGAQVLPRR